MSRITVTFYRSASASNGELYESPLGTYIFNGATEGEATAAAIREFQQATGRHSWSELADRFECICD